MKQGTPVKKGNRYEQDTRKKAIDMNRGHL